MAMAPRTPSVARAATARPCRGNQRDGAGTAVGVGSAIGPACRRDRSPPIRDSPHPAAGAAHGQNPRDHRTRDCHQARHPPKLQGVVGARPRRWRRRAVGIASGAGILAAAIALCAPAATADTGLTEPRHLRFPVDAPSSYFDDFGACRDGCTRRHEGNDIITAKGVPIYAAVSGTIDWLQWDLIGDTRCGNGLTIEAPDGWRYVACHLNNDTPGTDDGANRYDQAFGPGIAEGAKVTQGQLLGWVGDSGNAEYSVPHLHFEIRTPAHVPIDPYVSLRLSQGRSGGNQCAYPTNPPAAPASTSATSPFGYWQVAADGGIFSFGRAVFHGSTGGMRLNQPVAAMAATRTGDGYWLVAADGGIFAFGDAGFVGSLPAVLAAQHIPRLNRPVIGMAPTRSGKGYWLVASDGGVFAFGDARFSGSTGGQPIASPVRALAPRPGGDGYWLVAADGTVYGFGSARVLGRPPVGGKPAVGIAATASGNGYWVLTADGVVHPFGDAKRRGDLTGEGLCVVPVPTAIASTPDGNGYLVTTAAGAVYAYGSAAWSGDLPALGVRPVRAVLGLTALGHTTTAAGSVAPHDTVDEPVEPAEPAG